MLSDEAAKPLNRWTSVVAGMYIEICGGSVYITSLYLTTVKDLWFPGQGNADFLMQQLVFACNVRRASNAHAACTQREKQHPACTTHRSTTCGDCAA